MGCGYGTPRIERGAGWYIKGRSERQGNGLSLEERDGETEAVAPRGASPWVCLPWPGA